MTQVSTQTELQAALDALAPSIQVTTDFELSSQLDISYAVLIESLTPDNPFVLTKEDTYFAHLFCITSGGALTLQNIILDGNSQTHPLESPENRSLVHVNGGSLTLAEGCVLRNNNSRLEGGAISAENRSQVLINGGTIQNNRSSRCGGGLWLFSQSIATLSSGSFSGNESPRGRDIYSASVLYLGGNWIIPNGIYLKNDSSVIRLISPLTETSMIQLENSSYVSTNPEGCSVLVGTTTADYPLLTQTDATAFHKPVDCFNGWETRLTDDSTQVILTPASYQIQYENLMEAANPNPTTYTSVTPDLCLLSPGPLQGYRFLGWYNAPAGGTQISCLAHGSTGNLILYAWWEEFVEEYTISFFGNDSCCPKACCIPEPVTVPFGQPVTIPDVTPKRKKHCFRVWNTDPCGRGDSYLPGETLSGLTADLCLYAVWKRTNWFCRLCPPPVTVDFTARKLDASTGSGIEGAVFTLSDKQKNIQEAVSDFAGRLHFSNLKPGKYELQETTAPPGYQLDPVIHQVIVDIDAVATIDDYSANGFTLYNTPVSQ